tara:strand:- start:333 stop:530 length:198 start_codon:yes stop_codon:yes gene_type:complete
MYSINANLSMVVLLLFCGIVGFISPIIFMPDKLEAIFIGLAASIGSFIGAYVMYNEWKKERYGEI